MASALGVLANLSLSGLPGTLDGALAVLAGAALPSGLMAVGAALAPGAFGTHARGPGSDRTLLPDARDRRAERRAAGVRSGKHAASPGLTPPVTSAAAAPG